MSLTQRFRRLLNRSRFDAELADELRDHLERRSDDLVRGGLPRDEARRRAHVEFGAIEGYKEQIRDERGWVTNLAEQRWRDVRLAGRRLAAAPLFTLFSVATLALGIGVTTAASSFIGSFVLLHPGVRDPDRVVGIGQSAASVGSRFSAMEVADLRDRQTAFSGVLAFAPFTTSLTAAGKPELVPGEAVSGNYFQLLGVEPAIGRLLQPSDDRPDASGVVVLTDATWRQQFKGDPHIVGTTVRMAGRVFEIVGVAPASFRRLNDRGSMAPGVWAPLATAPGPGPGFRFDPANREARDLTVLARLAPGLGMHDADVRLQDAAQQLDAASPLDRSGKHEARRVFMWLAFTDTRDQLRMMGVAAVPLAIPALVLLVACTNLANLALSRGASRQHEFAVRRALGASRGRIVREQLTEGAMIAAAGGMAGLVVAQRLLAFVTDVVRETFGPLTPMSSMPALDPAVLAAAAGAALLAFLIASLVPTWQLTRGSDRRTLATETGTGAVPAWRGRSNLIALQVSVSVCLFLLTALGVTLVSSEAAARARNGLDHVAVVDVPFSLQQRDETRVRQTVDRIVDDVRRTRGVEKVSVSSMWTSSSAAGAFLTAPDRPFTRQMNGNLARLTVVLPDALRLAGTSIRFGRGFDERDGPGRTPVAVINESLAKKVFRTANAAGRDVLVRSLDPSSLAMVTSTIQVVGICADDPTSPGDDAVAYVPFAQHFTPDLAFLAQGSTLDVNALVTVLRTAVAKADPDVAISFAGRADLAGRWLPGVAMRMATTAAAVLATLALILAMAGLYGVLSHVVARRTRELGLRIALGADRRHIIRLVLKDGFRPIAEGLGIGLGVAVVLRLLLQPLTTQTVTAFDPIAFALAAGPLLAVGAIACYLPARRASRVDPNVALRDL